MRRQFARTGPRMNDLAGDRLHANSDGPMSSEPASGFNTGARRPFDVAEEAHRILPMERPSAANEYDIAFTDFDALTLHCMLEISRRYFVVAFETFETQRF